MVEHIRKEPRLKKSKILAEALAKDYSEITCSTAQAMEGSTGRRSRKTLTSEPGQFIRAVTYKCRWQEFYERADAELFSSLLKKSTEKGSFVVTEHVHDFGILETLDILLSKGSPLTHTEKAYELLSKAIKFGI